jgi:hypothetical protein
MISVGRVCLPLYPSMVSKTAFTEIFEYVVAE